MAPRYPVSRFRFLLRALLPPGVGLLLALEPAAVAAQDGQPRIRTLAVTGEGSVQVEPDLARVRIGVLSEARNARAASEENARKMARVMDTLRQAGIPADKIQTVQLTIEPVYDYNQPEGRPVLRGFQARNVVEAATKELSRLGEVLDASVEAGSNTVEGIRFELEEPGPAQADALRRAVADARRKAEALASAAGVGLKEVQQIDAVEMRPIPWIESRVASMEARTDAAAPPPVSPGELIITSNVHITYRLE